MRNWCRILVTLEILIVMPAALLSCSDTQQTQKGNRQIMADVEKLKEQVIQKQWDATDEAAKLGEKAVPALKELLQNPDGEIRNLALECIVETGSTEVGQILVAALSDRDQMVRSSALLNLRNHLRSNLLGDLIAQLTNSDAEVRAELPIMLGRLREPAAVKPMRSCLEAETNPDVVHNLHLALAKIGEKDMQRRVAERLTPPVSSVRYQTIQDLRYIEDPSLAPYLEPALNDSGQAHMIGPPHSSEYARVADAAVSLVLTWYPGRFPFTVSYTRRYTDDEIEQVRAFLKTLEK